LVRTQQPRFFFDDQQKQRLSKALKADAFLAIKLPGAIPNHTYEDLEKKVPSIIEKILVCKRFFANKISLQPSLYRDFYATLHSF
jgi:hypothetical protein